MSHIDIEIDNDGLQEVTASYLRCLGIHIEFTDSVQSTVDFLER